MSNQKLGPLERSVLVAILEEGESAFALEIRRAIEEAEGRSVSRAALYITLERLGEKGLVAWESLVPPNARRALSQRRYAVTSAGMASLEQAESDLAAVWQRLAKAVGRT